MEHHYRNFLLRAKCQWTMDELSAKKFTANQIPQKKNIKLLRLISDNNQYICQCNYMGVLNLYF